MVLEMSVFHIAILFGAAVLLIIAAVSDAQTYRIPNKVCAALLLLFPLFVLTAPSAIEWEQHLMVFGLMLVSGFVMFMGNIAGAGDIKLLAATGLWAGPHLVAVFLVTTAIAGGLLALLMALLTHLRNRSGRPAVALARVPIPYGVAISAGGLGTLYLLSQPILFPS
jgi:prepilin peptidase CpaA